jgi:hypothetical protein
MHRAVGLTGGLLFITGALVSAPPVLAQTLVITACEDSSGADLGKNATEVLTKAIESRGVKLIGYPKYLEAAVSSGVEKGKARTRTGIVKIARKLKLDGVITSSAVRQGGRYLMAFYLYNPDGKLLLKKAYAMKKPKLPPRTAEKLAGLLAGALGLKPEPQPGEEPDLALVPLTPAAPAIPPAPEKAKKPPSGEDSTPAPSPDEKSRKKSRKKRKRRPRPSQQRRGSPSPGPKPGLRPRRRKPPGSS